MRRTSRVVFAIALSFVTFALFQLTERGMVILDISQAMAIRGAVDPDCWSTTSNTYCETNVPFTSCNSMGCDSDEFGFWYCPEVEDPLEFPPVAEGEEPTVWVDEMHEITRAPVHACYKTTVGREGCVPDEAPTPCQVVYDCYCEPLGAGGPCLKGELLYNSFHKFIDSKLADPVCPPHNPSGPGGGD